MHLPYHESRLVLKLVYKLYCLSLAITMAIINPKPLISVLLVLINVSVISVSAGQPVWLASSVAREPDNQPSRANVNFRQEYPSPTRLRTTPRPVKPAKLQSSGNRSIATTTTTVAPIASTTTIRSSGATSNESNTKPILIGLSSNFTEVTTSPANGENNGEDELLCLLKLYTDIALEDKVTNIGHVDIDNNRLIFLIPLIIIYWHHRHPHDPMPYYDLEILLKELGDEARVHRRVLNKMILRIDECYIDSAGKLTIAIEDDSPKAIFLHNKRRQEQQARAAEALRVLDGWLSNRASNDNYQGPNYDKLRSDIQKNPNLYTSLSLRRSSAREIRHWFESFLNLNTSNRPKHKDRPTNTTAPVATTTTTTMTTLGPNRLVVSTTIAPSTTTVSLGSNDQNFTTTSRTNEEVSEGAVSSFSNASVSATLAALERPAILDTINDHKNVPQVIPDSSQIDLSDGRHTQLSLLNASQNNEFFDLVSSILMEMDTINNSTNLSI